MRRNPTTMVRNDSLFNGLKQPIKAIPSVDASRKKHKNLQPETTF